MEADQDTEPAPDTKPAPLAMPSRRTSDEIRELAMWLLADRVYNMGRCPENVRRISFFLAFNGLFAGWSADDLAAVTVFGVYGADETAGMGVNGYPIFMEIRVWLLTDYQQAQNLAHTAARIIVDWPGTVLPAASAPAPAVEADRRPAD